MMLKRLAANAVPAFFQSPSGRGRRVLFALAVLGAFFFGAAGADVPLQPSQRRLTQFRLAIQGLQATIDPLRPVVPKGVASGVRIVIRGGGQDLSVAEARALLGNDFSVHAELSGPGLNQTITLPLLDAPSSGDPLLLPLPGLTVAGDYALTNIRIVSGGRPVMDVNPRATTVECIDQILVTSVKTRPLTLDEIRAKGIVLGAEDYLGYEFSIGLKLDSKVVSLSFPAVFDRQGVYVPPTQFPGSTVPDRQEIPLPFGGGAAIRWMPMVLLPEGGGASNVPLSDGGGGVPRIPAVIVIPGDVGFLKQFFSAKLYVANGAPVSTKLIVRDVTGKIHLPPGVDRAVGTPDDPLALPKLERDGQVILQPTTMDVKGVGPDGLPGTEDDVTRFGPAEQGEAEFLLRGEREGYHDITFDVGAVLEGLPVGPVKVAGTAKGGVLVRNARFEMNFTVPTVVRRLERFKVFTTISNIGQGHANDVSVSLDTLRMANLKLIGNATQNIPTIPAGESKTLAFEFESQRTGQVTAAYLKFDPVGETDVTGKLNFAVGVSEQGVPLSPDTLSLPATLEKLPVPVVEAAMHVLGLAWSNANARSLPVGILRIPRQVVIQKALALAEVDLRNRLGQPIPAGLRDLAFDFYGGDPVDAGFDQLLRTSRAGRSLSEALGAALAPTVTAAGLRDYERDVAQLAASGPEFLSLAVAGRGTGVDVHVTDELGDKLSIVGGVATSTIEGGVFLPLPVGDGFEHLGLITRASPTRYTVALTAGADFAATFPRGDGTFSRVQGTTQHAAVLTLDPAQPNAVSVVETPPAGEPQTRTVAAEVVHSAGPTLLTAHVIDSATLTGASEFGLSAAFLFDRVVDAASAADLGHYTIPQNAVAWAKRQLSGRLVLATLQRPEGPYRPTTLSVNGLADMRGVVGPSLTVPLKSLLQTEGGIVVGRVLQADGQPMRDVDVIYGNSPRSLTCDPMPQPGRLARIPVEADGSYEIRYVRRNECGAPFKLEVQDLTTAVRSVQGYVRVAGDTIRVDIALVGTGSVTGTVRRMVVRDDGQPPVAEAVPGAAVLVESLVDEGLARNAITDARGQYIVHGLTVGKVAVRAAYGLGLGRNQGVIERTGMVEQVDVLLDAGTVSVSGKVFRHESGATSPLPGVLVLFTPANSSATGSSWTAADGSYAIDGMPTGPFTVSVYGLHVSRTGQAFANDKITGFDLVHEVVADTGPGRVGTVRGRVILPDAAGTAAAGVIVTDGDALSLERFDGIANYTFTAADGTFELKNNMPVGREFMLNALTRDQKRHGSARVFIDAVGLETNNILIKLSGLGTAVVKVLGPDNAPLGSQEVRLVREITNVGSCKDPCGCVAYPTDATGTLKLENMPVGSHSFKVLRKFEGVMDVVDGVVTVLNEGHVAYKELKFAGVGKVRGVIEPPDDTFIAGGEMTLTSLRFVNDGKFQCGLEEKTWYRGAIPLNNQYLISGVNVGKVQVTASNPFSQRTLAASGTLPKHGAILDMPPLKWQSDMGGELSGVVLLPDGVTPAGAGVEVRADGRLPDVTVWTNEDGRFAYAKVLPTGQYTITVRDPATGGVAREVVSLPLGKDVAHNVRLKGRGTVTVHATDASSVDLETAIVTLQEMDFPGRRFETVIDETHAGKATFEGVFEGRVSVRVHDAFRRSGTGSGTITGPDESIEIPVAVAPAGTVKGRFFMPDRKPIPYAEARLVSNGRPVGFSTTTSFEPVGSFEFLYVPTGNVRVELRDPLTGRTGIGEGRLEQDGDELYLDVTAQGLGRVEGRAWQSHAGAPPALVPNAQVKIAVGPTSTPIFTATTFTDASGVYAMDGVPEGTVTVTGSLGSATNAWYQLFRGSATGVLERDGDVLPLDVHLQDTGVVTGEVRSSTDQPFTTTANVTLHVKGNTELRLTAPTVASGTIPAFFSFPRVPTGTATATADAFGTTDSGKFGPFEVTAGTTHIRLLLNGIGHLTVFAQDFAGNEVQGHLNVTVGGGDFRNYFSQQTAGRADFPGVFAAPVQVALQAQPGNFKLYGQATGEVTAGSTLQNPSIVTVKLEPSGTVTGRLVHAGGAAAVGAPVTLKSLARTYPVTARVFTQSDGTFVFTHVPRGELELTASAHTIVEPIRLSYIAPIRNTLAGESLSFGVLTLDADAPTIEIVEPESGSTRAAMAGPLTVKLADAGSGLEPNTAYVRYANGVWQRLTVAANGVATATLQPSGLVVGPNRITVEVADRVGFKASVPIDFTVTGGTIKGHIRQIGGGAVGNAQVTVGAYRLYANADGYYEQGGLRPDWYTVTATDPVSGLSAHKRELLGDGVERTMDIDLPAFGVIAGVVQDKGQNGLAGVTVACSGKSTQSGDGGAYSLGVFRAGSYTVTAERSNGDRGKQPVTIVAGQPVPPVTIVMNGIGQLTVSVTHNGNAVAGADVIVKSSAPFIPNTYNGKTSDAGTVTFTGVLAGTITVTAAYQDLTGSLPSFTLTDGQSESKTIALEDKKAPKVVSVTPANGTIEVGLTDAVRVVFDEPLSVAPQIRVYKAGSPDVAGLVVLDPSNTATFTHPNAAFAADASYTVVVTGAKDVAGNTQAYASPTTFKTTDTVAPTLTWTQPPLTNSTETFEGWIKTARPTIHITLADQGSGVDLSTATMTLDGQPVVPIKSLGLLRYTPPADLAEGDDHELVATVKDRAGNLGTVTVEFGVDVTRPGAARLLNVANGQIISGQFALTATATDVPSDVDRIQVFVDNATGAAATLSTPSGPNFTGTLDTTKLTEGQHVLTVKAVDKAENLSELVEPGIVVVVNNKPLTVTINAPATGTRVKDTVNVKATVSEDVEAVEFTAPGVPTQIVPGTPGKRVFEAALDVRGAADGTPLTITVTAIGKREEASAPVTITIDRTAPAPPNAARISAEDQGLDNVLVVGIGGAVEADAAVSILNQETGATAGAKADGNGAFTTTIQGAKGNHLVLRATDQAGNVSEPTTVIVQEGASIGDVPTDGLKLWVEAGKPGDPLDSFVLEGVRVKQWKDFRGQATLPVLTQNTGLLQPELKDIDGRRVVRLDGIDDWLSVPQLTDVRTVFVLAARAEDAVGPRPMVNHTGQDHFAPGQSTLWAAASYTYDGKSYGRTHDCALDGQTWLNDAAVDGTQAATPAGQPVVVSLTTTCNLWANTLGNYRGNAFWKGDFIAALVYNRELSAVERKKVADYLALKYGVHVPQVAAPVISPNGGMLNPSLSVTLSTTTLGATVTYTLDGTEPTATSTTYTDPFEVSQTTTVKAKAFRPGRQPSATAVATFLGTADDSPRNIAGATLWLRADAGVVADAAGRVSLWRDQSATPRSVTQGTVQSQPRLIADAIGGYPALRFDGVEEWLGVTQMTDVRSVFMVVRRDADAAGPRPILNHTSQDHFAPGQSTLWASAAYLYGGKQFYPTHDWVLDGQTWLGDQAVDGTQVSTPPDTPAVVSVTTNGALWTNTVGNYRNQAYWKGDVAELVVFNRVVSQEERQRVIDYLASKYRVNGEATAAARPRITPEGGTFTGSTTVTLTTTTPGAQIHYSLDGGEPNLPYTQPFTITSTTTVKARTSHAGYQPSDVATATFIESADAVPQIVGGTNLRLWLRADAGISTNVQGVSVWKDQSANANKAEQAASRGNPRLVPNAMNGLPVLRFDGVDDSLAFTQITDARSLFMVVRRDADAVGPRPILNHTSQDHFAPGASTLWSSANYQYEGKQFYATHAWTLDGQTWLDDQAADGTQVSTPAGTPAVVSVVTLGNLWLNTVANYRHQAFWKGDIAELIVFNRALSPADQQVVADYLRSKYRVKGDTTPAARPRITPEGGTFTGSRTVTLTTTTPGAQIYYSLDGGDPNLLYTQPFTLTATTTVKARTSRAGFQTSEVATASFIESADAVPQVVGGANLRLWLRADAGISTDIQGVSLWKDQSAHANHADQAASRGNPRLVPDAINGLPVLRFDGVDDSLAFSQITDARSLFMVVRRDADAAGPRPILNHTGQDHFAPGASTLWSSANYQYEGKQFYTTHWFVLDGQTWLDDQVVDGTQVATPAGTPAVVSVLTTGNLWLNTVANYRHQAYWKGDIAELIVFNRALSAADRQRVADYLTSKYRVKGGATATARPRIAPEGGTFTGSTTVTLTTTTPGAPIYYSLDGATPSLYTEPLLLDKTTTVKAYAVAPGFEPSTVATATFIKDTDAVPTLVGGTLRLWLRADAGISTDIQSGISFWKNQAGTNEATQFDGRGLPRLAPEAVNGLPALRFDGANDSFSLSQISDVRTMFMVVRRGADADGPRPIVSHDGVASHFSPGLSTLWAPAAYTYDGKQFSAANDCVRGFGKTFLNGVAVDGAAIGTPAAKPALVSVVTTCSLWVNTIANYLNRAYWKGDVLEVIVFGTALDATRRQQVESYLASRYGLTLGQLP